MTWESIIVGIIVPAAGFLAVRSFIANLSLKDGSCACDVCPKSGSCTIPETGEQNEACGDGVEEHNHPIPKVGGK